MGCRLRRAHALSTTISLFALTAGLSATAHAQQSPQLLDTITIVATKTEEKAIDTLAPVSIINQSVLQTIDPKRLQDIFYRTPGVTFQDRGDSPESSINIRGLQDFGRVAVLIDGARQNYQRSGHNAQGSFYLEPELLAGVDIVRGPTANIYGSGAIGGVVAFRTKDVDDILRPGEKYGTDLGGSFGSNSGRALGSAFSALRAGPNVDFIAGGTLRTQSDYKDGNGTEIGNTANHVGTGLTKLTVRPWEGHEFKFGGIFQEDRYNNGQYNRGATTTAAAPALVQGTSVYRTEVYNYTGTAKWTYFKPEDRLFNWDANVYWNRVDNDQVKIYNNRITAGGGPPFLPVAPCSLANPGNNITGCVGDTRGYLLDTVGFDVNNTSRFDLGDWRNAFTIGADGFQDDVTTNDNGKGNSNITTPGGVRTVSGGFAQWRANYSTWLEIISAVRYDNYQLEQFSLSSQGDRFSPKITVGITPFPGFTPYVSYAEGYRAPAITETLIAGAHATGGGPTLFPCPTGGGGLFCFLPNPQLRPEVGKNKEIGVNLKYDNVFFQADAFRAKFNVFRNDIDDYIELTASTPVMSAFGGPFSQFQQYKNIDSAHIQGFEAEATYDAGGWFVGIAGQIQRGYNDVTNVGLLNIQPNKIATTLGLRSPDRTVTLAGTWISAASNQHIDQVNYIPNTSYELLNIYLTYQPTKDLWFNFGIDNVLDRYYRPYAVARSADSTSTQNDVLWTAPPPGIVYKAAMRIHFGAM
jgi:hemoglobin/transferrin/lactoferrin receptor protein